MYDKNIRVRFHFPKEGNLFYFSKKLFKWGLISLNDWCWRCASRFANLLIKSPEVSDLVLCWPSKICSDAYCC